MENFDGDQVCAVRVVSSNPLRAWDETVVGDQRCATTAAIGLSGSDQ